MISYELFRKSTRLDDYFDHLVSYKITGHHYLVFNPLIDQKCPHIPIERLGDDLGIYHLYAILSSLTGIQNELLIYDLLFFIISLLAFIISTMGFYLYTISLPTKTRIFILFTNFLFFFYSLYVFDLYLISYLAYSFIPLTLYLLQKSPSLWKKITIFLIFGLIQGYLELARSLTGASCVIFVGFLYCINFYKFELSKNKTITRFLFIFSFLTFIIPLALQNIAIQKRNQWLTEQGCSLTTDFSQKRTFWHIIYIGLYANTDLGIKYADDFAFKKTGNKSLSRFNYSAEYDEKIKKEVMDIFKKNPLGVLWNYAIKTLPSLFPSILVILLGVFIYRKMSILSISFVSLWLFNLIQPILSSPLFTYKFASFYTSIIFLYFAIIFKPNNRRIENN